MKFEYPISSEYVKDWGINEALRELFQNIFDQQTEYPECVTIIKHEGEILTVGNKKTVLEREALVLGSSTKRSKENLIGFYGEGFKLALLVLLREGHKISIYNGAEYWDVKLDRSEIFHCRTMQVEIFEAPEQSEDVEFVIHGIAKEVFEEYKERDLRFQAYKYYQTPYGQIIYDKGFRNKIFVGGQFVCNFDGDFKAGYNFNPGVIKLDRDRKMVENFDVKWEVARMWACASKNRRAEKKAVNLIKKGVDDMDFIDKHISEKTIELLWDLFRKENPEGVPVSSQAEMDELSEAHGNVYCIITDSQLCSRLKASKGYRDCIASLPVKNKVKLSNLLQEFYEEWESLFNSDLYEQFESLICQVEEYERQAEDGEE